jgi:hypothetical protein
MALETENFRHFSFFFEMLISFIGFQMSHSFEF